MSISVLDPTVALVVIDLQKGILALPAPGLVGPVLQHSRQMADAFRARKLPVVLVNVAGGAPGRNELPHSDAVPPADWVELSAEIDPQPGDHYVTKRTWGAFTGTDLHQYLQGQGVTQIVLCGVATSIGVESTARQAHELGYNVAFAVDAMADLNADTHANSIQRMFPRIGETGTSADVVAMLASRD